MDFKFIACETAFFKGHAFPFILLSSQFEFGAIFALDWRSLTPESISLGRKLNIIWLSLADNRKERVVVVVPALMASTPLSKQD